MKRATLTIVVALSIFVTGFVAGSSFTVNRIHKVEDRYNEWANEIQKRDSSQIRMLERKIAELNNNSKAR